MFFPSNANFVDEMQDPLDDSEQQKRRDDKLWVRNVLWVKKYQ